MDIKQLEAFCMVVRQGSFSRAARVLGVSQPTVSAHISTLEKELGCELLIRTSKSILPTDKGATLLGYAQGIMSLRQKALEELSREDSRYTGSITIAASSVPAQYCLPELLSEFSREYPGVSYQLHNTNSLQAVEEVRRGKADIALTGARVENTNCEFTSFLKDELVIITANNERFIARELGSGTRMEYEQLLRSEGIEPGELNTVAEMNYSEAVKKSVAGGLGIAIISIHAISDELSSGRLLCFNLGDKAMQRDLYLVIRRNRSEMSTAALFSSFVLRHYNVEKN